MHWALPLLGSVLQPAGMAYCTELNCPCSVCKAPKLCTGSQVAYGLSDCSSQAVKDLCGVCTDR